MKRQKQIVPNQYLLTDPTRLASRPKVFTNKEEALNDYIKGIFGYRNEDFFKFIIMIADCILRNNLSDASFKCFTVKDSFLQKHKLFKESVKTAADCSNMLYKSRQFTSFEYYNTNVGEPFLLYVLNNLPKFKSIIKEANPRPGKYLNDIWAKMAHNWVESLDYPNDYYENINKAFDATLHYFSQQECYSKDDIDGNYKYLSVLLSMFMEYYIQKKDVEHINKIFKFLHVTGNVKAHKYFELSNPDVKANKAKDRPLKLNSGVFYYNDEIYYYYIKFYKEYANGKYLKNLLPGYLINFIESCRRNVNIIDQYRPDNIDLYQELFNTLKTPETFNFETFMLTYSLSDPGIPVEDILACLEQNFKILDICLTDGEFLMSRNRPYENKNLFLKLSSVNYYDDGYLNPHFEIKPEIRKRYFKLISNYINNCGYSNSKVKTILKQILITTKLEGTQLISETNQWLSDKYKAILLEIYL